jgi:hypothetical protein
MKLFRLLVLAAGAVVLYRKLAGTDEAAEQADLYLEDGAEPVLGYDGMDLQTVVPWLESANLDRSTLLRIRAYETRNEAREAVLDTLDSLLS